MFQDLSWSCSCFERGFKCDSGSIWDFKEFLGLPRNFKEFWEVVDRFKGAQGRLYGVSGVSRGKRKKKQIFIGMYETIV